MSTITKIIADFQTRLSAQITAGGTSGIISNNFDSDGNVLPDGYYFFTLDGNNSLKEYIYCLKTGTALTNIYSVSCQGVKVSGTKRTHRYAALVGLTNFAQLKLLNDIMSGTDTLDATTPLKYDATATISNDKHIATKAYADAKYAVISACAKASATVLGIALMSVVPASAPSPIAVGTLDPRIPTQDENNAMAGSYGSPSGANVFVTADNSARLNNVDLSTDQTVAGVKTFTTPPIMPGNPASANDMANKAYALSVLYTS